MTTLSRRQFLKYSLVALSALSGSIFFSRKSQRKIPLQILGPNLQAGHRLRTQDFPEITETREIKTLIVGAGIAGLSAAWWLKRNHCHDFCLIELEDHAGGNSHSGKNEISAYPWGAHYVPVPGPESIYVRELFEELGVITGYKKEEAIYNDYMLCAAPEERLYLQGQWQEGLIPHLGISKEEENEFRRFFEFIDELRKTRGRDGKKIFCIPIAFSSQDQEWTQLDQKSFTSYLIEQGYRSPALFWYLDYCCRDDYGCKLDQSSAWAGLHYFAARTKEAPELTWPEGNGWIVKRLTEKISSHLETQKLLYEINEEEQGVSAKVFDLKTNKTILWKAKQLIYAGPQFTFAKVFTAYKKQRPGFLKHFSYAPWMVANLSLSELPAGKGAALSWDNVFYQSKSLGYVVATHQNLQSHPKKTVLTYYYPLCEKNPEEERKLAFERNENEWKKIILDDFLKVHPELENEIEEIKVWIWGHAMIRPQPGFIWGEAKKSVQSLNNKIFFAHSDLSGISIFEEAQYWGVEAAKRVLRNCHCERNEV